MNNYPDNWKEIATQIKEAAGWKCERCKEPNRVEGAFVLTVHHLDGNKANCEDWNLAALCQRCHLRIQGRVKMDQMFFQEILDVAEWFKPHLEGYLKSRGPVPCCQRCGERIPAQSGVENVRLLCGLCMDDLLNSR